MATAQRYTFLGLTVLLTILARVQSGNVSTTADAKKYLIKYGYLPASPYNSDNDNTFVNALKEFQSISGLNTTGTLDTQTMQRMSLPRCSVRDKMDVGNDSRSERFVITEGWNSLQITYKILSWPKFLDKSYVFSEIAKAFAVWSEHTDLTFELKHFGHTDITIEFGKLDGKHVYLASAVIIKNGGSILFDIAESWTIGNIKGIDLFQVAAHEIGHSLGLAHSYEGPLMAPVYHYIYPFYLHPDDINGIQYLYGKKLCKDPKIDTMFNADGETYIFKGNLYYKMIGRSVDVGYPKFISDGWAYLPGNIDAAYTYSDGKTYFFKGNQYWRYTGKQMDWDYPRHINKTFTGVPSDLDAAMFWRSKNKIFFFKGDKFQTFDPATKNFTSPEKISNLKLPNNLDAAFEDDNDNLYIFQGHKYYWLLKSETTDPFPFNTKLFWFDC